MPLGMNKPRALLVLGLMSLLACEPEPTPTPALSPPPKPPKPAQPLPALESLEREAQRFGQLFAQVPNARTELSRAFAGKRPVKLTLTASRPGDKVEHHQHQFKDGAELFGCLKDPANGRGPWSGARYFGPCALTRPLILYLDSPRRFAQPKLKACVERCCEFEPITQHINSAVKLRRVCYREADPALGLAPEIESLEVYGYW